ncbi:MAG: ABC transporter permease [Pyrinomonadaceae bacterium]
MIGTLMQDFRYGVRMLVKKPGFTVIAVIALALGIGANSAIFSVVNAVLLRPLPFDEPERLMQVWATNAKRGQRSAPTSYLNFVDWRDQNRVFDHMAAYTGASAAFTYGETPEQLEGAGVTADLFKVLGTQPLLGRTLLSEDERPNSRVVVLSYGLWQRRFNGDPKIIGQQVKFDGDSTTVVGVMPKGFIFPLDRETPEFWVPLDPQEAFNKERGANYLSVIARLKEGTTLEQAQAEMDTIGRRLEQEYPDKNTGKGIRLISLHENVVGNVRPALLVLLSAVGFVLLIACANVANLLLARASSRSREIAIRTALGASRARIIRQLLTESLLLSIVGGAAGLLLALWGVDVLGAAIPADIPRVKDVGLDASVLLFTIAVSLLTGILFGLAPALQASKPDFNEALKEGGRGSTEGLNRNRVRSLLVVSEVALSLVLLIGAGLMIKSFLQLLNVKPGFEPEHVLTANISLPPAKYADVEKQSAFFKQVIERTQQLPGVDSVAVIGPLPLTGSMIQNLVTIEGRPPLAPGEKLVTNTRIASADYLRVMGIPLQRGRNVTEHDDTGPDVFLVNETFARRFFPGEDPIGKRISLSIRPSPDKPDASGEIVGVVGDVKHQTLDKEAGPECYVPAMKYTDPYMTLVARTASSDPAQLTTALRGVVQQVDKDQPVADIRTMNQVLAQSVATRRFNMLLLGLFACIALLLAAVGIFGVMNYSVSQRIHEIGIRMALGAQGSDILRMIVGQGMILTLIGVALGLIAAYFLTRVMSGLLYGVSATDPLTFVGVSGLLVVVALLACYIPARRATKVDPMIALRYE